MWKTGGLVTLSSAARAIVQDKANPSAAMMENRMGTMVEEGDKGVKSQSPMMLLVSALKCLHRRKPSR